MRKNLRWVFYVLTIVISIEACKDKNAQNYISADCKDSFDSNKYTEVIKNNFKNPSDSASICFTELNNFDTLNIFYSKRNYKSVWFSENIDFTIVDSIINIFNNSYTHGLKSNWYYGDVILSKIEKLKSVKVNCDSIYQLLSEVDILLSNALIDYSNHLNHGFFNPLEKYDKCYFLSLNKSDSSQFEKIFNPDSVLPYLNAIQPKGIDYKKLQAQYLKLLNLKWDSIPPADTPKICVGDSNIVLKYIANRLIVTGELDSSFKNNSFHFYDTSLEKAIIRFQSEHGLLPDGVIGKNSIVQMNISAKDRAIQVAVNLERLRWNSFNYPAKHLKINIPEFMLYAYNADTFKLALKVCCGEKMPGNYNERMKKYLKTHKIQDRPPNHETPIFQSKISHLVLNPDWLVPTNIVQKELYYNFIKDPFYLRDHEYKVYRDKVEINPDSINWKKYDPNHIPFRIKQNPGEINALGKIKFVFPNPYDVFLHDTPSKNAFDRAYRAVSHGCVRVEDPLKLVKLLLDDKKWELDDIRMAIGMEPEDKKDKRKFKKRMEDFKEWKELAKKDSVKLESKTIFFKKQVPIVINYYTAFIDTNGFLQFRDDLYKRDLQIIKLLK